MNMKKLMAGVVASAMAVGTMAVAASAADGYLDISTNWGNDAAKAANAVEWIGGDFGNWTGANVLAPEGSGLTGENAADYTLDVTVVIDGEAAKAEWLAAGYDEAVLGTDGVVITFGGNSTYASGFGKIMLKVNEDGTVQDTYNISVAADKVNLADPADGWYTQVQLGHFSGVKSLTIEYTAPADAAPDDGATDDGATDDGADNTPADDSNSGNGDTSAPTNDKTNADTGVEGVAVVAGLAIVAAGAVVVAKKRK